MAENNKDTRRRPVQDGAANQPEGPSRPQRLLSLGLRPLLLLAAAVFLSLGASAQSSIDIPPANPKPASSALPAAGSAPSSAPTTAPAAPASPATSTPSKTTATPTLGGSQGTAIGIGAGQPSEGLPRAFRGIELGMSLDEVCALLAKDPLFSFRGKEDLSLLPSPNQSLVEASGLSFVRRAFFQFVDDRLWVMIFLLNPERIDHYTIYTSLVERHGEPSSLDPKETRWEDGGTRLALERPLTLRYLDLPTLASLRDAGSAKASLGELELADFLGGL